jgi:hyperpolarization activated cyclic nucleotide-gated potassium channel 2
MFGSIFEFVVSLLLVWGPEEPQRVVWDIISMLFIFIQMLIIPVIICFDLEIDGDFLVYIVLSKDRYLQI